MGGGKLIRLQKHHGYGSSVRAKEKHKRRTEVSPCQLVMELNKKQDWEKIHISSGQGQL